MQLESVWHFPRPALAERYLALLNSGIVASTTIFAPRRTGKTSFLLKDFRPAAEAAGYTVGYADLWQTRDTQGTVLIRALEDALEPKTLGQALVATLRSPVRRLKASTTIAGTKLEGEVDLGTSGKEPDQSLRLADLIGELVGRGPVCLLVDEAQELSRNKTNERVATALRTAMTLHQDRLRVVFTGSSRGRLSQMFSNASAPLYSAGAAIQEFPRLDRAFVAYVAERFRQSTARLLDVEKAVTAFESMQRLPEPFLRAVLGMVLDPALLLENAIAREQQALENSGGHEAIWTRLDALQRFLVQALARDPGTKLFGREMLAAARKAVGVEELETTHVQRAAGRLADLNIIYRQGEGRYGFEDETFARWVCDHEDR